MYSIIHLEPTNIPLGCTQKTDRLLQQVAQKGKKTGEEDVEDHTTWGSCENIDGYEPPN